MFFVKNFRVVDLLYYIFLIIEVYSFEITCFRAFLMSCKSKEALKIYVLLFSASESSSTDF